MSHTLADVTLFKLHLTDSVSGISSVVDPALLATLEGASRSVESFADRSDFGSGFGPRIVTSQRYTGSGSDYIDLRDDFLGITSVAVYWPPTQGTATYAFVQDTDYYLEPYVAPYRGMRLHGLGQFGWWPNGSRILVSGTAGYANTIVTTSVTMGTVDASSTSITVSAGSVVAAGHTIHYGTEDIYVTAVTSGTALTVKRGQNGTTAAPIAAGGTVSLYTYDPRAVEATLAVAQRRWKQRDAGLSGDFGITQVAGFRDTEKSILRSVAGPLRVYGAG